MRTLLSCLACLALVTTGISACAADPVTVTLTEWKIEMPRSIPAGTTTFRITNAGHHKHTFEIKGEGIKKELPNKLKTGESADLTVDLKPGAYRVDCPIGFGPVGHASRGMDMTLTVTPAK